MQELTIMCVDDDPTALSSLRTLLGQLGPGHAIEIAESGAEALEIEEELREQGRPLAVVISDFIMPQMQGDELLIRLHTISPATITIMLTGQSAFEGVKRAINKANLYRFLEKPFNSDDILLTVKSACIAFQDQIELTRQNQELKSLNSKLEQMLETVNNAQKELARSEAKATISTLVASVSHELATPFSNSLITAEMLQETAANLQHEIDGGHLKKSDLLEFTQQVASGSDLLKKNLERASTLLQHFKQVAADQASEQRRQFDLAEAVREILATLAPSLRKKSQKVDLQIPPGILMDSYPGALGQIVINLVNNAYLHAFEGVPDGVLVISAGTLPEDDDQVRLCFADNGVGIAAENLAHLLEPFFSTKIGHGGTGLGMSIVDNLVSKTLQGKLEIASTVGVGTTVTICLPRCLQ